MSDLKRRLAPLDTLDVPERWPEIRNRAPRAGLDPEPPRLQRALVVALTVVVSLLTIGWLASGFGRPDPRVMNEPTPTVTPTPSHTDEPSPSPVMDPKAVDLGIGFGLCEAESIRGRFGDGIGRVWFGTRTDEVTLECRDSSRRHVAALDADADGTAESWVNPIGPHLCALDCGLFGLTDADGDGNDEVVLTVEGGVVPVFGVLQVGPEGSLTPVTFEPGGGPTGWPSGGIGRLVIGGDEGYAYAITCERTATGDVITQHERISNIDAEDLGTTVRTTTFRLEAGRWRILSDETVPGVQDPPPLPKDSRLCDVDLEDEAGGAE